MATSQRRDQPRMHPQLLTFESKELEERFKQHHSASLLQLDLLSCLVGAFIWALVYLKVNPIAKQPLPLRWCWVGVSIYLLPPLLILKATGLYMQKREYIVCLVRVAVFLVALELKQRVTWLGAGAGGGDSGGGGGSSGDVPVAFHILMASCVPFLISSSFFLRLRFPLHLAVQTLAVAKLLAGEAGLCRAAVHQCPSGNCQQSMLLAAQSISHYSGAFPVPHTLLGFPPDRACPLLLAFLQLVLGHALPSFLLYVTERYAREVFLANSPEHRRPYPQDSLDLNLVIFSLALLPPLVSLLWLLLELVESWGMGPGWSAAAG